MSPAPRTLESTWQLPMHRGTGIVVVIHGIHTSRKRAATWMPMLGTQLRKATGCGIAVFKYGWTSGTSIRLPLWGRWSRRSKLAKLRRLVRRIQKAHPGEPVSVVAHSFGTWLAFHAGRIGKPKKHVRWTKMVLMAGVIDVDQEFEPTMAERGFGRGQCQFSRSDDVIRKAPMGHCGAWGFLHAGGPIENADMTPFEHDDYTKPGRAWDAAVQFLRP